MPHSSTPFAWTIATPPLFRYLPEEFVSVFMQSGAIRLSTFAKFRRHTDEQRLDLDEGKSTFLHRTKKNGGQSVVARLNHGMNAYVLSTTMRHSPQLMSEFGCDSFFRINDSTAFGISIAKKLEGVVGGLEGQCIYQTSKVIERDLGFLELPPPVDQPDWKVDRAAISTLALQQASHFPLLMKHSFYQLQFEYRLVWIMRDEIGEHIDIEVPEAIGYCSGPNLFAP